MPYDKIPKMLETRKMKFVQIVMAILEVMVRCLRLGL